MQVHFREAFKTGKDPQEIITRKNKLSTLMETAMQDIQNEKPEDNIIINSDVHTELLQPNLNSLNNIIIVTENSLLNFGMRPEHESIINETVLVNDNKQKDYQIDDKVRQEIENLINKSLISENENKVKTKPKHICKFCSKEFSSKYLLERHTKVHTNEKNFVCTLCSKSFNQKNALDAHIKVHIGSRPYACPHCSNTFSQRGNLKTHIKR